MKPSCPDDESLQKLLAGELDEEATERIDRHLLKCDHCLAKLDASTSGQPVDSRTPIDDSTSGELQQMIATLKERVPVELSARDTAERMDDTQSGHGEVPDASQLDDASQLPTLPGYEVQEQIGFGGCGRVYRGVDRQLHRVVALKVLHPSLSQDPTAVTRLSREATSAASLNHNHIVRLYSFDISEPSQPFLVMEYVDGQPLDDLIRDQGVGVPHDVARSLAGIADALQSAHDRGVIHRDVKSSNILVESSTGQAKITDFGLARLTDATTQLTLEGMLAGTPSYMSPEQIRSPSAADAASDVYSLGVVMYEWLTGVVPFRGTTRMVLHQVQHDDPTPLRKLNDSVPIDLETICLRCLAKAPTERYSGADELAADLRRFLAGEPVRARRLTWWAKSRRWARRNPRITFLWSSVATIFLLALAICFASALRLSIAYQEVKSAEEQARQQATAATQQRDASLRTIRKLVVDVPKALSYVPEDTTEVEELVSRIALDGLEEISQLSGTSDTSLAAAMGNFQLGATLWRVGELEQANEKLRLAQGITENLPETSDEKTELQVDIDIHLALIASEDGRTGAAQTAIDRASRRARQWAQQGTLRSQLRLAECLTVAAEVAGQMTADDPADLPSPSAYRPFIDEAEKLLRRLEQQHPDNEDVLSSIDMLEITKEILAESHGMLATEFGVSRWTLEEIMQWDNAALSHHVEGEWELASRAIADVDRRAATEALHNLLTLMQTREDALQVELSPLAAPQVYAETMLQLGRLLLEDGQTRSAHQLLKQCSEFLSEDGSGFPEFSRYQRATQLGTAYAFLDLGRDRRAEEAFKTLRTDLKTVISAMANQAPAAKHGREALAFKMMLLEVELGLLYLEEFSDEQFSNSLQTLEEAAAQLRSAPDSQRPYDFALWDARIRVELESLREQVPLEARCLGSMVAPATESSQAGVPRRFRTANDR